MSRNFPAALDYLGSEAEDFCKAQHLYLKPIAIIKITVTLPKMTIPGQSISNWDLMERLKRAVDPIQMDSIKVRESNMDSVIFEAELLSLGIMEKTMKILEGHVMKVSGFAEPLKVKTKQSKTDFPSRHDWDLWYLKNKMDETKPGERPDTIYLSKIPVKWFSDGRSDLPSEKRLKSAFEEFGKIRRVDIPICDPLRVKMNSKYSGIQMKGFGIGQDIFFEAYVQYMEYKGFAFAMDALRNRKWAKRIDGRFFQASVKVDFDRTRHLSESIIAKRAEERRRIENEQIQKEEEEMNERMKEELRVKQEQDEKDRRREEREKKRREKRELERLAEEEKRRKELETLELENSAKERRKIEATFLLNFLFQKIEAREERRKRKEEDKLREELTKIKCLEDQPVEQEDALRQALLKQRELRMRERLKEKMKEAAKSKEIEKQNKKGYRKKRHDSSSSDEKPRKKHNRRYSSDSSDDSDRRDRHRRRKRRY
ncbi:unnamed protein product [Caenorhabditis angaria]|uniref:RRM domain-containing protein n=1 Tax=Caenorhabditis angaria TaxID=860376 RepID=A0A9P1IGP3_9PELO|nr:unnamed protein product [Caenorhabditis angaria]